MAAGLLLVVGRAWAPEPTTQASGAGIRGQSPPAVSSPLVVTWTKGSGAESLVVMREGGPVNADPVDGTPYTASTAFGSGSQIGTGNWVVYAGTATSVPVTVPRSDLPYHVAVYSYDPSDRNYLQANPARTNSGHNAAHGITNCGECHMGTGVTSPHGTFSVPRGTDQAGVCKSCHNATGIAAGKSAVNLHQGTKYGKVVDCGSCHNAHNGVDFMTTNTHPGGQTATNVNWVRKDTTKYAAGWQTNGPPLEPALYQATTGFFAFDDANSPWNGICQTCHTGTDFHRNNNTVVHSHPSTPLPLCTTCHTHAGPQGTENGFRPSGGACTDCHNQTQGALPRRQIVQSGTGSGEFGGTGGGQPAWRSHHVNSGAVAQVVTKWDCVVCHAEGDVNTGGTTSYHNNVPSGQTACNAPNPCPVDLKNVDTGTVLGVVAPDSSTDWRNLTAAQRSTFCMSCHDSDASSGAGFGGARLVALRPASPPAGDPNAADYTTVAPNPFKDSVTNHHEPSGFNGTPAPHSRGQVVDVKGQFTTTNIAHHAVRGAAYTGALPAGFGTGLTNAIKGGGTGTPRIDLAWNSTLNCEDCHYGNPAGNKLNGHGTQNARYMLRDKNGADTYPTPSTSGNLTVVCFRCHIPTGDPGSYDTSLSTYEVHTRGAHIDDTLNLYGISCLNCHGGGGFGGIHGWNAQVTDDDSGGSYNPNVFTIGAALDLVTNWTSWARRGVSCSAKASNTLLTQCTQHSSQTYSRGVTRTYRAP